MRVMLDIDIDMGNECANDDDIARAISAAYDYLDGHDIYAIYKEFKRQITRWDDYDALTGDARLWVDAEKAADIALTENWYDTSVASCSLKIQTFPSK